MVPTFFAWLSFADPDRPEGQRFLGVIVTRATAMDDTMSILRRLHHMGINPGGECFPRAMSAEAPVPEEYFDRLLTRTEAEALDELLQQAYEGRKVN